MLPQRGKTYGQDLRERVFAASDGGMRVGQIAARLLVSVSYVSKVLTRRRLTGERTARPQRCHVPAKLAAQHEVIRARVCADATIDELRAWLLDAHQVSASAGLMWKTLAGLGLTLKKDPARGRTEPPRCRQGPRGMARRSASPEPGPARVH